jgi:hypothetical protein
LSSSGNSEGAEGKQRWVPFVDVKVETHAVHSHNDAY